MKKNKFILYSSLGVIALFIYLYRRRNYVNANAGGYYSNVPCNVAFNTQGCKTIEGCTQKKLNQIKCEIRRNERRFNEVKANATKGNFSVNAMLHKTAMNIFTNNGQRTIKESLSFYGILPNDLAIQDYWDNFFKNPELIQIITQIKSNSELMGRLTKNASEQKKDIDRLVRMEALKIYRQNNRTRRQQQQQGKQSNLPITATTGSGRNVYIDGYGFVPVYNLTQQQFDNLTQRLVNNPSAVFQNLPEGTYQVRTSSGQTAIVGTSGGGSTYDPCSIHTWGSFNWNWCRMMKTFQSGMGTSGGY